MAGNMSLSGQVGLIGKPHRNHVKFSKTQPASLWKNYFPPSFMSFFPKILLAVWVITGGSEAVETSGKQQPNIVFIFSDDHSLQPIGAYGARLSEFCRLRTLYKDSDAPSAPN